MAEPARAPGPDELDRAQAELGRALGRARAGEDAELSQRVREAGEALARVLTGLLKLTRVHAADNRAFDQPVAELGRVLGVLEDLLGTVHLVSVEDQVYVNDVRVRFDVRSGGRELAEALARHEAGGLAFHAPLDGRGIRALVTALAADPAPAAPRAALARGLGEAGVGTVEPEPVYRFSAVGEGEPPLPAGAVRRLYAAAGEALDTLAAGRFLNALSLRRAVVRAVDADLGAREFWQAPPPEVPLHAAHAVRVGIVALLLGKTTGFAPAYLQDLGIAALVHDAGYFSPGAADAADAFARHPVAGARVMLAQRGFREGKLRRLRAVLEHHRDLRGAPAPSVTGAILRIAEDYETLTRLHGGRVLRATILGGMLRADAMYHPPLVQLLVNALGRHPPGTRVELCDGRAARVAAPPRDRRTWELPLVELLEADGVTPSGTLVDTAQGPAIRAAFPG